MKVSYKSAIINISLPPELLVELDKWAKLIHSSRSEFIREAVRRYLQSLKREEGVEDDNTTEA